MMAIMGITAAMPIITITVVTSTIATPVMAGLVPATQDHNCRIAILGGRPEAGHDGGGFGE